MNMETGRAKYLLTNMDRVVDSIFQYLRAFHAKLHQYFNTDYVNICLQKFRYIFLAYLVPPSCLIIWYILLCLTKAIIMSSVLLKLIFDS